MIEALFALALATALPLGLCLALDLSVETRRSVAGPTVGAGAAAAIAVLVPRGFIAGLLIVPWVAAVAMVGWFAAVRFVTASRRGQGARDLLGPGIALVFLAVGCAWLVFDRLGVRPLGYAETIVLLTAVHFHVAGFALTLAGVMAATRSAGRLKLSSVGATIALIVGMPLTAAGFLGLPVAGWVGALLVSAAGIAIGTATIGIASTEADGVARRLLRVAGGTLLLTMPLAAAYATGTTFAIPFLDVPAMAAVHGGLNVIGFAIPAMVGWSRLAR
jgi:YndJ-like protein